jgi:hypothetical protein
VLAVVHVEPDASCVHCVEVVIGLVWSCRRVMWLKASWSCGLGSTGFCSEMSLSGSCRDCITKCS